MHLQLQNFKCYEKAEYNFSLGLTRIKGSSGIGKTTIFEALQWVLYNYPTTNIYSHHGSKDCLVILEIDGVVITRKKNPSLLTLTCEGRYEEDDVAQATINYLFGNKDIWRVCSYLPQNENCPLLNFSNTQRMEILETLSFDENPDEDIAKITQEIKRLESAFRLESEILRREKLPEEGVLLSDPEEREKSFQELKSEIKELERKEIREEEKRKQRKILEERLKIPLPSPESIEPLQEEISSLEEELLRAQKEEKRQDLIKRKEKIQLGNSPKEFSEKELEEALITEKRKLEEEKIVRSYKLPYLKGKVEERVEKLAELLEGQKEVLVWDRIQNLRNKLKSLEGKEVSQEDVSFLREKIKILEGSIDVLKCPSCQRSLRYIKGQLVFSETSPVPRDKIKRLKEELSKAEIDLKKSQERSKLMTQLETLLSLDYKEGKSLTESEVKKYEKELNFLQRLSFPSYPFTSSEIKASFEYYKNLEEKERIEEELRTLEVFNVRSIKEINGLLKEKKRKLEKTKEEHIKRVTFEKQRKVYQEDLRKLGEPQDVTLELEKKRKEYEEIKISLDLHKKALEYMGQKEKIEAQKEKVNSLNSQLGAASQLRVLAQEEICRILEEKILIINQEIADVCEKVFSDPITVELSMIKTTKTTKVTRPCVHLKILYKGGEYDSLSHLSGGEGKRISIAVSLALSHLNNFPWILLDECLAGLDEELKEATLDVLRESEKNVLCIMHDGVEGYYDHTIEIS